MKVEDSSACVTTNCKSCNSVIALYLNVIKRDCVTKVLTNPIIRTGTRHFRHAYQPTRDNTICHHCMCIYVYILIFSPINNNNLILMEL
jgi:hypothetical protein